MKPSVKRNTCQCFLFFKLQTTRKRLQSIHCANIPLNSLQSGKVPIFPHHRIAIHSVLQNERTMIDKTLKALWHASIPFTLAFDEQINILFASFDFFPSFRFIAKVSINRSKLFPFFLTAFETRNSVADFHELLLLNCQELFLMEYNKS